MNENYYINIEDTENQIFREMQINRYFLDDYFNLKKDKPIKDIDTDIYSFLKDCKYPELCSKIVANFNQPDIPVYVCLDNKSMALKNRIIKNLDYRKIRYLIDWLVSKKYIFEMRGVHNGNCTNSKCTTLIPRNKLKGIKRKEPNIKQYFFGAEPIIIKNIKNKEGLKTIAHDKKQTKKIKMASKFVRDYNNVLDQSEVILDFSSDTILELDNMYQLSDRIESHQISVKLEKRPKNPFNDVRRSFSNFPKKKHKIKLRGSDNKYINSDLDNKYINSDLDNKNIDSDLDNKYIDSDLDNKLIQEEIIKNKLIHLSYSYKVQQTYPEPLILLARKRKLDLREITPNYYAIEPILRALFGEKNRLKQVQFKLGDLGIERLILKFNNLSYQRIFNNHSWKQGGRFYNSITSLSSNLRDKILINGQTTCELDYSSFQLRLLYHINGIDVGKLDLYKISDDISRDDAKLINIIALNVGKRLPTSEKSKMSDVEKEELVKRSKSVAKRAIWWRLRKSFSINDALKAFETKHEPIAHEFYTCVGLMLQNIEADIAESIMKSFYRKNIVCLSIHDSFIVQKQHRDLLYETMKSKYYEKTGYFPLIH